MAKEVFLVAYAEGKDGERLLSYAVDRAKKEAAALLIVHVLEWSPYTFLTQEELAERHARRRKEMARAQSAIIDPALETARAAGLEAAGEIRYGAVVDLVAQIAVDKGVSMIFVGRSGGGSGSFTARVFGSVPIGLAQVAPVPTVIVP